MKTTIDIPDQVLRELVTNSKSNKKKEAILEAIKEFNQKHKLEKLSKYNGTFEGLITKDQLLKLRKIIKV